MEILLAASAVVKAPECRDLRKLLGMKELSVEERKVWIFSLERDAMRSPEEIRRS